MPSSPVLLQLKQDGSVRMLRFCPLIRHPEAKEPESQPVPEQVLLLPSNWAANHGFSELLAIAHMPAGHGPARRGPTLAAVASSPQGAELILIDLRDGSIICRARVSVRGPVLLEASCHYVVLVSLQLPGEINANWCRPVPGPGRHATSMQRQIYSASSASTMRKLIAPADLCLQSPGGCWHSQPTGRQCQWDRPVWGRS